MADTLSIPPFADDGLTIPQVPAGARSPFIPSWGPLPVGHGIGGGNVGALHAFLDPMSYLEPPTEHEAGGMHTSVPVTGEGGEHTSHPGLQPIQAPDASAGDLVINPAPLTSPEVPDHPAPLTDEWVGDWVLDKLRDVGGVLSGAARSWTRGQHKMLSDLVGQLHGHGTFDRADTAQAMLPLTIATSDVGSPGVTPPPTGPGDLYERGVSPLRTLADSALPKNRPVTADDVTRLLDPTKNQRSVTVGGLKLGVHPEEWRFLGGPNLLDRLNEGGPLPKDQVMDLLSPYKVGTELGPDTPPPVWVNAPRARYVEYTAPGPKTNYRVRTLTGAEGNALPGNARYHFNAGPVHYRLSNRPVTTGDEVASLPTSDYLINNKPLNEPTWMDTPFAERLVDHVTGLLHPLDVGYPKRPVVEHTHRILNGTSTPAEFTQAALDRMDELATPPEIRQHVLDRYLPLTPHQNLAYRYSVERNTSPSGAEMGPPDNVLQAFGLTQARDPDRLLSGARSLVERNQDEGINHAAHQALQQAVNHSQGSTASAGPQATHLDELQSDFYSEPKASPAADPRYAELQQREREASANSMEAMRAYAARYRAELDSGRPEGEVSGEAATWPEYRDLVNARNEHNTAYDEFHAIAKPKPGRGEGPFEKLWPRLAFNQAAREALEAGHDYLTWSPPGVQDKLYQQLGSQDLSQRPMKVGSSTVYPATEPSLYITDDKPGGGSFSHPISQAKKLYRGPVDLDTLKEGDVLNQGRYFSSPNSLMYHNVYGPGGVVEDAARRLASAYGEDPKNALTSVNLHGAGEVPALRITPKMRSVYDKLRAQGLPGVPLYRRGGRV